MSLDKKEPTQGLDAFMAEEGLGGDETLRNLLSPLAKLSAIPAPPPGKELAALMALRHTPSSWQRWLHKHRPIVVGIAVLVGMGAGATGVAASNPDTASSIYRSIMGENASGWSWWWEEPVAVIGDEDPEAASTRDSGVSTGSTSEVSESPTEIPVVERAKARPPVGQRTDTVPRAQAGQRNNAPGRAVAPPAGAAQAAPGRPLPAGQVPPAAAVGNVPDPYLSQPHIPQRVQFQLLGLGPVLVTTIPQLPGDLRDLAFTFEPPAVDARSSVEQPKDQLATARQEALPAADAAALDAFGLGQSGPLRPGLGGGPLKEGSTDAARLDPAPDGSAHGANHRANPDGDEQTKDRKREAVSDHAGIPRNSFLPAGLVGAKPWPQPALLDPEQDYASNPAKTPSGQTDFGSVPHDAPGDAPVSDGSAVDAGTSEPPNEDGGGTGDGRDNVPANQGRATRLLEPVIEAVQPPAERATNGNRPGIVRDTRDLSKGVLGSKR